MFKKEAYMKRPIEQLIKYDDILCHETRATEDNSGNWWLLHCFIAKDDKSNPCFLMGCEQYSPEFNATRKIAYTPYGQDLSYNKIMSNKDYAEKTKYGYLNQLFLCTPTQADTVFTASATSINARVLDPSVPLDVATGERIKHQNYEEMVDNSIYSEDAIAKGEVMDELSARDYGTTSVHTSDLGATSSTVPGNFEYKDTDDKETHSLWHSDIHFSKVKELNTSEFLSCFNKYKQYINQQITPNINQESEFNIAMQDLFGTSYDLQRIKTKIFKPEGSSSEYEHLSTQASEHEKTWTEKIKEKLHLDN
jgi:hypothetical protein